MNSDLEEHILISYLLGLNLVGVILELMAVSILQFGSSSVLLTSFVARFYLLYLMSFFMLVTLYIYTIFYETAKNGNQAYYKILKKILFFVYYIAAAVMLFVPIIIYNNRIAGPAFNYVYLCLIIYMSSWLITIVKNIGKIDRRKIVPVGILIILTSLILVAQRFEYSFNMMAIVQVLVMISFVLVERITSRKLELQTEKVDKNDYEIYDLRILLEDLVEHFKGKLGTKAVQFRILFDEDLPNYLKGDGRILKQICTNVLSSSIENTNRGFVEFKVDAIVRDETCKLIMTIEDTGNGINEDLEKILANFENQSDNTEMNSRSLFLAETKNLVENIGGKFVVQCGRGAGTKFTIAIEEKLGKKSYKEG